MQKRLNEEHSDQDLDHLKDANNNTLHRIQEQLAETDCLDTPYGREVNKEVMERLNNPPSS